MNIMLRGAVAFDQLLGKLWERVLFGEPVDLKEILPKPPFIDPSGKFMRAHLAEWIDSDKYKEQYHFKIEDQLYHVMYVPLKSTWYTVAYYYNRHKLPALGAFTRYKKTVDEMRDFTKAERIRKKKENLKVELRQKHH